jgi:hypothetical protein
MSPDYLTLSEVIEMHRQLIEQFGGTHGLRGFAAADGVL